ncbi:MAG TPA: hypothetical protein VLC73_02840 [Burkholderiales bacterium]|nr:hypothetical protein [Burkholderiales bacterium]
MSKASRVPGSGWFILAGAVALCGFLAATGLVARLVLTWEEGTQFLAPGRHALTLKAGHYVVWNDHVTVFEGRSYHSSKVLPDGLQVTVTGSEGAVPVRSASGATYKGSNTERVAVMQFDVARPGRYEIAVLGNFQPRVFSVGPDHVGAVLWTVFGVMAALFISFGAGIGIAAWAFLRREQARAAAPRAAPAEGDARESALRRLTMIVYILQIASIAVGITLIAAVIINYVKRRDVEGTWLESHFRWQIRTFWWSLLWFGVGLALLIVIVGIFVLIAAAMWLLYRAIKGWLELEERRPLYS